MPAFGPIKRKELIRCLRQISFEGPYSGGRHRFMVKNALTIRLPNPQEGEIGPALLIRILRQAQVSREEWEKL
jgi:predicted RNA binding protein YcfA (HicA-like mRNA interferase family)